MRNIIALCLLSTLALSASARGVSVKGYVKPSTGQIVLPSHRTAPDSTRINNFSTKGNTNPYTGKSGSKPVLKPLTGTP